ncbi:hypothetical protein NEF87_003339 [Candidatus Lokiarchaeum ossiferum]|uniref:Uncharacterized protein n=1 Tax=Candidatus Lokiarchaeum ossiferum TaxID=2951803 RepID=A0ABY6HX75_9ARCH|nr:hypothetical protein NEF87_003339 [Candidatus Lokiarchaeum sp. B-35]
MKTRETEIPMKTPQKPPTKKISMCPDCHTIISEELSNMMLRGASIYCETCGFKIEGMKGIERIKPIASKQNGKKHKEKSKTQTPKDDSWTATMAKWQKDWDDFVKDWKEGWTNFKNWFKIKWTAIKKWFTNVSNKVKKPFISSPVPKKNQLISSTSSNIPQTQINAKFDPYTGKRILPAGSQNAKFNPFTGERIIPEDADSKLDDSQEKTLPLQAEKNMLVDEKREVFTVLAPEIREKLLSIDMSSEERTLIAKSFIYLTEKQQGKYLEELENVNTQSKNIQPLIHAIKELPISQHDQDFLIDQLNYIPEKEHETYVATLKEFDKPDRSSENVELNALEKEKFQREQDQLELEALKRVKQDLEHQMKVKKLDTELTGKNPRKSIPDSKKDKKEKELQ